MSAWKPQVKLSALGAIRLTGDQQRLPVVQTVTTMNTYDTKTGESPLKNGDCSKIKGDGDQQLICASKAYPFSGDD